MNKGTHTKFSNKNNNNKKSKLYGNFDMSTKMSYKRKNQQTHIHLVTE